MPERDSEVFSNPLPPADHKVHHHESDDDDDEHHMTNEDFRKLLMTPKEPNSSSFPSSASRLNSQISHDSEEPEDDESLDPATRRRNKKIFYARLKRTEEERQKELDSKYRDRARERRDGSNKDYEQTEIMSTTADYRAVAPDAKSIENYAERRKQVIQESKYLGGDMEHTHLVKGLDYALLEKVRAEITSKEREVEDEMDKVVTQTKEEVEVPEVQIQFKTKLGRNIHRALFKPRHIERNELFLPKRMAYIVDLEDEYADLDVPTTLIRSKADCPTLESSTTLTTNDIVINKLTQILSYLREGRRDKKLKKKDKGKGKEETKIKEKLPGADDNIYGDIADYTPMLPKSKDRKDRRNRGKDRDRDDDKERDRHGRNRDREHRRDRVRESDRDRGREKKSYFEKPAEEHDEKAATTAKDLVRSINDRFKGYAELEDEKEKLVVKQEEDRMKKLKAKTDINSYAECYPGMMESADAIDDSDDEVDYTKMDQGNKKGPVGRWDFDTQEEYSIYMSNKEAMPKAAFQYGVKMADGRKTRRTGPKDEKAELDRQWQKIQKIIEKRKVVPEGGNNYKRKKY